MLNTYFVEIEKKTLRSLLPAGVSLNNYYADFKLNINRDLIEGDGWMDGF